MTKKEQLIEQINKLKQERDKLKNLANIQDLAQLAYKIFLNSTYGALGSVYYPCFDLDNAEAVTLSGQTVTREMVRFTNQILNELVKRTNEDYVIAGDTDSASGLTKLRIKKLFSRKITIFDQEKNIYKTLIIKPLDSIKVKRNNKIINIEDQYQEQQMTIEQLWNQYIKDNNVIIDKDTNRERIELNNKDQIQGLNGWTNISKIFRHKVNKNRWKIGIKNKAALYVTEDHSIIVYRDNQLIECKPSEILPTDHILINNIKEI